MANFGFILKKPLHDGQNFETMYNLAMTALEKQHGVSIFLYSSGVFSALKGDSINPGESNARDYLGDLVKKGAVLYCNSIDIKKRGISNCFAYMEGIKMADPSDLAEAMAGMDRLISL